MKHVLVAYDFSSYSRRALGLAMQGYPFGSDVELEVFHVIDEQLYENVLSKKAIPSEEAIRSYFEADIERAKSGLPTGGRPAVEPTLVVKRGHPYEVILERLGENKSCGLLIGGQGHGGIEEKLLGRTARRALHHSQCPVYVTKKQEDVSIPRAALCATDLSEQSQLALQESRRLTTEFGISFSTIHVIASHYVPYLEKAVADENFAEELERILVMTEDDLVTFEKSALGEIESDSRKVVIGDVHREIILEAENQAAETIVVASHQRTGLKRVLLGSVSEGLLDRSEKDIFVVR